MPARKAAATAPSSSRASTRPTRSAARKKTGTDRDSRLRPGTAPELLQHHESDEDAAAVADLVSERGNTAHQARKSRQARATRALSHKTQASTTRSSPEHEITGGSTGVASREANKPVSEEREQPSNSNPAELLETIEHAGGTPIEPDSASLNVNEHEHSSGRDDRRVMEMIETLPELWDSSRKLVRLLAPADIDANRLRALTGELQDEESLRYQNRNKLSAVYSDIFSRLYDRAPRLKPAEAQMQLLSRGGIQTFDEIPHENLRVDEIFYMANLSILINEDVPPDGTPPQYNALYFLSEEFPDPYLSGIGTGIGATKLINETLEIATMFRVECLKSIVFEQGSRPDFVFEDALVHTFYKSDGDEEAFKSFGSLSQFQSFNLGRKRQKWIGSVVAKLRSTEEAASRNGEDLLQALRQNFPPEEFAVQFIRWISARGRELELALKSRSEEVEDLQKNLHEFGKHRASKEPESLPRKLQPAYEFEASQPPKSSSRQGEAAIRSNQNNSRNREFLKQKRAATDRQTGDAGRMFSERKTGAQQEAPSDTVMVMLPSVLQGRKAGLNAEAGPKGPQRSLMDAQPNAVREEWRSQERAPSDQDGDFIHDNADEDPVTIQDGRDEENEEQYREKENDRVTSEQGEEADDFQEDTRTEFQRARRAPRKSTSPVDTTQKDARSTKRQKTGRRNRGDAAAAATEQGETSEQTAEEAAEAERMEAEYRTSEFVSDRQRHYRNLMETAKAKAHENKQDKGKGKNDGTQKTRAVKNPVKKDRSRKFWEEIEDDALLAGLAAYKETKQPFYHIKKFFQDKPLDPLVNRSNVDLKDRTRVITFQYLRDGIPLQKGLSKSHLKRNHQEALENMGIDLSEVP